MPERINNILTRYIVHSDLNLHWAKRHVSNLRDSFVQAEKDVACVLAARANILKREQESLVAWRSEVKIGGTVNMYICIHSYKKVYHEINTCTCHIGMSLTMHHYAILS